MLIGQRENIDNSAINNVKKISIVSKAEDVNIDLKNNQDSNLITKQKETSQTNKSEAKNHAEIAKLEQKLSASKPKFETSLTRNDYSFDKASKSFISKTTLNNDLVISQYPTEDLIRLKMYMLKNQSENEPSQGKS